MSAYQHNKMKKGDGGGDMMLSSQLFVKNANDIF